MQVTSSTDNEDGTTTVVFDMTKEEEQMLLQYGILMALKEAIKEGEKLTVEGNNIES